MKYFFSIVVIFCLLMACTKQKNQSNEPINQELSFSCLVEQDKFHIPLLGGAAVSTNRVQLGLALIAGKSFATCPAEKNTIHCQAVNKKSAQIAKTIAKLLLFKLNMAQCTLDWHCHEENQLFYCTNKNQPLKLTFTFQ